MIDAEIWRSLMALKCDTEAAVRIVIRKLALIFWDRNELKTRAIDKNACRDSENRKWLENDRKNALKGKILNFIVKCFGSTK